MKGYEPNWNKVPEKDVLSVNLWLFSYPSILTNIFGKGSQKNHLIMDESFQDYSWIQAFEADSLEDPPQNAEFSSL